MKHLSLLTLLLLAGMVTAQTNSITTENSMKLSECEQYRKVMDENMELMKLDDLGKSMIVGDKGQFYKSGMSNNFTSAPMVPDYIFEIDGFNPYLKEIIIAHVDLYYCDLVEKHKSIEPSEMILENINIKTLISDSKIHIFPNPSDGIINIKGEEKVNQIVVFNSQGRLVKNFKSTKNTIDLSNLNNEMYFVYLIKDDGIQVEKVMLKK